MGSERLVTDPVVSSVTAITLAVIGSLLRHHLAVRLSRGRHGAVRTHRPLGSHLDRLGTLVVPVVLAVATGGAVGWARPASITEVGDRWRAAAVATTPVLLAVGVAAVCALVAPVEVGAVALAADAASDERVVAAARSGVFDVGATAVLVAAFWLVPVPWLPGGELLAVTVPRTRATWLRLRRRSATLALLPLAVLATAPPVVDAVVRLQADATWSWSLVGR